jgi:hypothetical protein
MRGLEGAWMDALMIRMYIRVNMVPEMLEVDASRWQNAHTEFAVCRCEASAVGRFRHLIVHKDDLWTCADRWMLIRLIYDAAYVVSKGVRELMKAGSLNDSGQLKVKSGKGPGNAGIR